MSKVLTQNKFLSHASARSIFYYSCPNGKNIDVQSQLFPRSARFSRWILAITGLSQLHSTGEVPYEKEGSKKPPPPPPPQ